MNDVKGKFSDKDTMRISVIYMFLISVGFMNYIINQLFDVGGMIWSLGIVGIAMVFCYKTIVKIKFPAMALALGLVITLYFVITRQVSVSTVYAREFAFYFLATSVLALYKCDTEKVLRYISLVSVTILFFYKDIYVEMNSTLYQRGISMGLAYSLLPILLAVVFHFFYYRKSRKQSIMYVVYAISLFLLVGLILKGNRGIALTVVVALCLVYIKGTDKSRYGRVRAIRAVVITGVVALTIIFFSEILLFTKDLLDSWRIEAYFVDKILNLTKVGDVTNGREQLFKYTISEIMKKPIFGHGIATMAYYGGKHSYAHNFILQLLYDGGLVLTVPVLLIIGRAVYYIFCGEDKDEAIFAMYMFCATIPRAFFTGDVWENSLFWLFVMHSLAYHTIKRKTGFENMALPEKLKVAETLQEGVIVGNDE